MNITVDTEKLTAEEKARREYEILCDPQFVRVKIPVVWKNGICFPDSEGKLYEEAEFKVLTFGDNHVLDKASSYDVEIKEDGKVVSKVSVTDLNEYRQLLVRRNLLSWSLDIPIERQGGWMTAQCWEKVKKIPAPLMEAFIDQYDARTSVTKDEEEKVMKQSSILFGRNSRGVMDACEAVSLFCTLGNFWEKFGVGRGVPIQEMPFKEYIMLKMIIGKENESMKVHNAPKKPLTRIAGAGGRPRASQGVVVEG
jgi:hypothetical protein